MSYNHLEPPRRARVAVGALAAFFVVALVGSAVVSAALNRSLEISVDEAPMTVAASTTVADLYATGAYRAPGGDLLGVDGSVLERRGGNPPRVLRNGSPAASWQRLYQGDRLISREGSARTESLEITNVPIPYATQTQGSGQIPSVTRKGVEGLKRVTRGSVSGVEVSSVELVEAKDRLVTLVPAGPDAKLVALTFDDGPWKGSTDDVLAVLARHEAPATFFMPGSRVKRSPEMARRVAEQGHLVGSHSQSHKYFTRIDRKDVRAEIKRGRATIKKATGVDSPWLRPPYGAMDEDAWKEVEKAKARVVLWDVDSRDWKKPGASMIAKRVVAKVKPGSIVLLHDGGGDRAQTVAALPAIIRGLREKGYVFVTVEQLVGAEGVQKGRAARTADTGPE